MGNKVEVQQIRAYRSSDHDSDRIDLIRKGLCILLKKGTFVDKYEDLTTTSLDQKVQHLSFSKSYSARSKIGIGRYFHEGDYTRSGTTTANVGRFERNFSRMGNTVRYIAEQRNKKIILRFREFGPVNLHQIEQAEESENYQAEQVIE